MSAIEWTRESRRVLVPVVILAPYPITNLSGIETEALLDTGSSVSGVAVHIARSLDLKQLGKRPLSSAHGEGQIERYAFRIGLQTNPGAGAAPAFPFVFDEVIGIELTDALAFSALLGMDILGQCDFEMLRSGRCRLCFD